MPGIDVSHAYHVVPGGASKGAAVGAHMRARGYEPEQCIAVGDSIEDLESAQYAGRFFCVANGPERDRALREALPRYPNATVTEARMGDGVYEAVVATLAGAPGAS
jgi:hydroxymethylpyrimidine pyrophosphatase-like HAD family hydrolase